MSLAKIRKAIQQNLPFTANQQVDILSTTGLLISQFSHSSIQGSEGGLEGFFQDKTILIEPDPVAGPVKQGAAQLPFQPFDGQ